MPRVAGSACGANFLANVPSPHSPAVGGGRPYPIDGRSPASRKIIWPLVGLSLVFLAACGGGSSGPPQGPVTPSPSPGPSPTPAPAPSPSPPPALDPAVFLTACTAANGIVRGSNFSIRPVANQIRVVAIGSSSTEGIGASAPENTYPAVLQTLLSANGKAYVYTVFNKGVGGNLLSDIDARLNTDAKALNPQIVILQTGYNDSNAGVTSANFYSRLTRMVTDLKPASPVILMNAQFLGAPSSALQDILSAMERVSSEQNVPLFDRYSFMRAQVQSGRATVRDLLASDVLHPNDLMQRCTAQILVDFITNASIIPG